MPPKARLKRYLSCEELKNRYRQAQDMTEARRWHLLFLISQKWSIKRASQIVGINYDYAKEILGRYNREGPTAMRNRNKDRQLPPAKSLLSPTEMEELSQVLKSPPADGGKWSGPKVAKWIAEKTGRTHVWPQRGWDYLKRLGLNVKDINSLS